MSASLRALLDGIIDYAGLFPPANLSLERAIRNYARHRQGEDQWMLGRFVIPAARLAELAAFESLFEHNPPFHFVALGRGGNTPDEFVQGLSDDLRDVAEFGARHGEKVAVDVFEVKLPDPFLLPQNQQSLNYTLVRAADLVEASGWPLTCFYEIGLGGDWRGAVRGIMAALDYVGTYGNTRFLGRYRHYKKAGLKLRCGGKQAAAFPTPQQVAHIIVACRDRNVALKATAGLHHPIRRFDDNLRTHWHGFLNFFCSAVLAVVHGLNEDQVRRIIEDEDPIHCNFDDHYLRWNTLAAPLVDIAGVRHILAVGFGSCSFDEPCEDLRALRLL